MKPDHKLYRVLSIIFAILTVASIVGVYYTRQLPLYENRTTTLCTYLHRGTYDYVASLLPNIIYNLTKLGPGEGTLYASIVEKIDLEFAYSFTSTPRPSNITVIRGLTIELESPDKWNRTLTEDEARELLQLEGSEVIKMSINETKIRPIIERIEEETGLRSTSYNLNVRPEIHIEAIMATRRIEETFIPELEISFITGGEKGNYIEISELRHSGPWKITENSQIHLQWVEKQRNTSYLAISTTSIALAASVYQYIMMRPEIPPSRKIEKLISQHKELITESTQEPPETSIKIDMETLEDLAKTAEIIARPIIHTKKGNHHIFYIMDEDKKYEYRIDETQEH